MAIDIAVYAVDLNADATTVVTTAVGSMLVALFTLFVRAMSSSGARIDARSDAEMVRKDAELVKKDAEIAYWRDLYLAEIRAKGRDE